MIKLIICLFLLFGCTNDTATEDTQEPYYVWYSEKQSLCLKSLSVRLNQAILDDSTIVIYTELTRKPKPSGVWGDYIYLGRGEWHEGL